MPSVSDGRLAGYKPTRKSVSTLACIIHEGENSYRKSSWFYDWSWSFRHNWI